MSFLHRHIDHNQGCIAAFPCPSIPVSAGFPTGGGVPRWRTGIQGSQGCLPPRTGRYFLPQLQVRRRPDSYCRPTPTHAPQPLPLPLGPLPKSEGRAYCPGRLSSLGSGLANDRKAKDVHVVLQYLTQRLDLTLGPPQSLRCSLSLRCTSCNGRIIANMQPLRPWHWP